MNQMIVRGTTIEIIRTIFPSILFPILLSTRPSMRGLLTCDCDFESYMIPEDDLEFIKSRLLEVDNRVIVPARTHISILFQMKTNCDRPASASKMWLLFQAAAILLMLSTSLASSEVAFAAGEEGAPDRQIPCELTGAVTPFLQGADAQPSLSENHTYNSAYSFEDAGAAKKRGATLLEQLDIASRAAETLREKTEALNHQTRMTGHLDSRASVEVFTLHARLERQLGDLDLLMEENSKLDRLRDHERALGRVILQKEFLELQRKESGLIIDNLRKRMELD